MPPLPPGPAPFAPRNLLQFSGDPIGFLTQLARRHGRVSQFHVGLRRLYFVNDPELVREVLVAKHRAFHKDKAQQAAKRLVGEGLLTSEGDFHKRQRRLAQPAFHRERIAAYGQDMVRHALRTRDRWHAGETFDVAHEMMRLTLGIVGKTLFGTDVESEADELGAAITELMDQFSIARLPVAELLDRVPLPSTKRFHAARERLDRTVYRIIAEHRAKGQDTGDLLSMLLLAQDTEGDGGRMTDLQVRDEAMTLFLAGHETTANALTWTWYLLSLHPTIEARMHAELDQVLGGRAPEPADFKRLGYVERVFSEALRLYPPAWAMGRLAQEDVQVGRWTVPAGDAVVLSQWVMHHDPEYYPDPDRFDPDRWLPEQIAKRPKFSYFPFGAGPRMCIGEGFAWMEAVLLLATIAQRWRLRLLPGQKVRPLPRITLRPEHGIQMRVEERVPATKLAASA